MGVNDVYTLDDLQDNAPESIQLVQDPAAMAQTKQFEGWRDHIYDDKTGKVVNGKVKGKRTIGNGFNIDDPYVASLIPKDILSGERPMDHKTADPIFEKLYSRAQTDAMNLVGQETYLNLPPVISNILDDMSYNLGVNKLAGFKKAIKALRAGDYGRFGEEIKDSDWYDQVGNRSQKHYMDIQNFIKPPGKTAMGSWIPGIDNAHADEGMPDPAVGDTIGIDAIDPNNQGRSASDTPETAIGETVDLKTLDPAAKIAEPSKEVKIGETVGIQDLVKPDANNSSIGEGPGRLAMALRPARVAAEAFIANLKKQLPTGLSYSLRSGKAFFTPKEKAYSEEAPVASMLGGAVGGVGTVAALSAIPGVGLPVAMGAASVLSRQAAQTDNTDNPDVQYFNDKLAIAKMVGQDALAGVSGAIAAKIVGSPANAGKAMFPTVQKLQDSILGRVVYKSAGAGATAIAQSIADQAVGGKEPDIHEALGAGLAMAVQNGIISGLIEVPQLRGIIMKQAKGLNRGVEVKSLDEAKAILEQANIKPETLAPEFVAAQHEAKLSVAEQLIKENPNFKGEPAKVITAVLHAQDVRARDGIATKYMTDLVNSDPATAKKLLPFFQAVKEGADPADILIAQRIQDIVNPKVKVEQMADTGIATPEARAIEAAQGKESAFPATVEAAPKAETPVANAKPTPVKAAVTAASKLNILVDQAHGDDTAKTTKAARRLLAAKGIEWQKTYTEADKTDLANMLDWEENQQIGDNAIVSGGTQMNPERFVSSTKSARSLAMQEVGMPEARKIIGYAQNNQKLTDLQHEKLQKLLKDYRENTKTHLESALSGLNTEIDNATQDLSESETKQVNDAFAQESKNTEYDWDGNPVEPNAAAEQKPGFEIAPSGNLRPELQAPMPKELFQDKGELFKGEEPKYKLEQSAPPFYSHLERTIEAKMPNAAAADHVRGILKSAGVKQEEIDWTDIEGFLKENPKPTKQALLEHVRTHNVQLQEVEKKNETKNYTVNDIQYQGIEEQNGVKFHILKVPDNVLQLPVSQYPTRTDAIERALQKSTGYDQTKFQSYQLPGGSNYRELLLTLPNEKAVSADKLKDKQHQADYNQFVDELRNRLHQPHLNPYDAYDQNLMTDDESRAWVKLTDRLADLPNAQTFKSGHFAEPNILAHIRMNDRTDAEGKKVLFVEEVQSDWHQKGRKQGYNAQNTDAQMKDIEAKMSALVMQYPNMPGGGRTPVIQNQINAYGDELNRLTDAKRGVPNAPFKKSWHELAMKRMLRYAAENGYDKLAWTTGEQQAERYDLSKQVNKIDVTKMGANYYNLMIDAGRTTIPINSIKGEELEDHIGKELAQKIINDSEAHSNDDIAQGFGISFKKTYSGLDLKVGGEGMKGFYDQILPSFMNKYAKRWGGRVQYGTISHPEEYPGHSWNGPEYSLEQLEAGLKAANAGGRDVFISPFTGEKQDYAVNRVANAMPLRDIVKEMKSGKTFQEAMQIHGNGGLAELMGGKFDKNPIQNVQLKVHSIDITPSMRASVLNEGQPMFKRQPTWESLQANKAEYERLNAAGRAVMQKYLPQLSESLVNVPYIYTKEGARALGMYFQGRIEVKTGQPEETYIHEIGHAVFDLFLTPAEKRVLLKAAGGDEERLMKDFERYYRAAKNQQKPTLMRMIQSFFERMVRRIKRFFGMDPVTVKRFYDDILAGEYAKREPMKSYRSEPAYSTEEAKAPKEKERKFIKTIRESPHTLPEVAAAVESTHIPIANPETMRQAQEYVKSSYNDAVTLVHSIRHPTAFSNAVALEVIRVAQNNGFLADAVTIAVDVAEKATSQGQAIQALSMWNRLSPEGVLLAAVRTVKKAKEMVPQSKVEHFKKLSEKMTPEQIDKLAEQMGIPHLTEEAVRELLKKARALKKIPSREPTPEAEAAAQTAIESLKKMGVEGENTPPHGWKAIQYVVDEFQKLGVSGENMGPETKNALQIVLSEFQKMGVEGANTQAERDQIQYVIDEFQVLGVDGENTPMGPGDQQTLGIGSGKIPRDRLIATALLLQEISKSIPKSFWEKVSMTQTLAQLLNPKTMVRNFLGNLGFQSLENMSDFLATGIDMATYLATGKRTVGLPSGRAQATGFVQGMREGTEESLLGIDLKGAKSKFDLPRNGVFDRGVLAALEKTLRVSLGAADRAFYQAAFNDHLRQDLAFHKTTEVTEEMIERAHQFGLYRTFQDDSLLARQFITLKKWLNVNQKWGLGDIVLKYPKTPANILSRGLEYSMFGFTKTVYEISKPLMGKGFNQEAFVRSTARALTGSVLMVGVGALLGALGIMTGKRAKDKDVEATRENVGIRDYQINVSALKRFVMSGMNPDAAALRPGDIFVSYDWFQPQSIALALGANMATEGNSSITDKIANAGEKLLSASDTLQEQPLVSGVKALFSQQDIGQGVSNAVKTIPASFIPTVVNQVRQITDNTSRNTRDLNYFKEIYNKSINRIPGLSQGLPARIDSLGQNQEMYQGGSNNPFNVFLNPAFVNQYKPDPVSKMVLDIWEKSGEAIQFPRVAGYKVKIPGSGPEPIALPTDKYTEYQKYIGQKTQTAFQILADDPTFMARPDLQKAKYLQKILTNINQDAKRNVLGIGRLPPEDIKNALKGIGKDLKAVDEANAQ